MPCRVSSRSSEGLITAITIAMANSNVKTRSNSVTEMTVISDKLDKLFSEMQYFREETKSLGVSINSTHEKIEELSIYVKGQLADDVNKCVGEVDKLKQENINLKKEVVDLKQELSAVQQYSRANCVDIQGVPESAGENILEIVRLVARAIRFTLGDEMVDAVHRLRGSDGSSRPRGIILKFVRRLDCDEFLRLARVKKVFSASELGVVSESKVFINQSMTQENRLIMAAARSAVRDGHFKFVWFRSGKVLVRSDTGQPAIHITSRDHLRTLTAPSQRDKRGPSGPPIRHKDGK